MVKGARGVILIHVLILTMLLAWLAAMFLSAVLSRQINAKVSMASNEIRTSMSSVMAAASACLEAQAVANPVLPTTCGYSTTALNTCLTFGGAQTINKRPFKACVTGIAPPCKVTIKFGAPGDAMAGVSCP